MKIYSIHLLWFFIFLLGCNEPTKSVNEENGQKTLELINTDKSFSELCLKQGMKAAYLEYLDSNGVLLRPNQIPIIGANTIDYIIQQNDESFVLSWNPQHAEVSASGELGFTYGIYAMKPAEMDTIIYGTYNNVWKRQSDNKWKLLLNTENKGIE